MMMPKIRCSICNKPVDRITVWEETHREARRIEVECHGDKDVMVITQIDAIILGPDALKEMEEQEGVAFTTKRIEK